MSIHNVLIVGGGGSLGPSVLKEFLDASYKVTLLSRPESTTIFPAEVNVIKSDYSPESLTSAFANQDVVISLVGFQGWGEQQKIVDAAVAAGVKRFFPSEYGPDTSEPKVLEFIPPLKTNKRSVVEYLISKEPAISWTALCTGAFFDWGLKNGFLGIDIANKTAQIYDGGDIRFHGTNVATIAKALVACISTENLEKTKNQYVLVASHTLSQNELLTAIERVGGAKYEVTSTDSAPIVKSAREKLSKGDVSEVFALAGAQFYADVGLPLFNKVWNDELGLPKEDLDEDVRRVLEGN